MRRSPLFIVITSLAFSILWTAKTALAHGIMLSATPSPNSLYAADTPPTQVKITFSEEIVPAFSAIHISNQAGETMDNGDTRAVNSEKTILVVSLKPLPPGVYTVAWEILSAIDGHSSRGSFVFGVGVESVEAAPATVTGSTPASLAARWLMLTGQVLLFGVFAFRFFVWQPALNPNESEDSQLDLAMARQAVRIGWFGLGLVGLGLIATLLAQQNVFEASTDAGVVASARAWLGTRFGGMWAIRVWLSLGLAFALSDLGLGLKEGERREADSWVWWAALAASVALGLTSTLTSHSAALQQDWQLAVVSDGAHRLAAGVWVGGLVQLVIATRLTHTLPNEARIKRHLHLIMNFSALAAIAVGVLLVSGVYLAWQHIRMWTALFETPQGAALLVKAGLALPAFVIAALNLFVIKPRFITAIANHASQPDLDQTLRSFYRLVLMEMICALAVAAAAGVMADFQRGRDALQIAEQLQTVLTQLTDDVKVTLTIEPGQWGQSNIFDIDLFSADGKPLPNVREVSLRFTFLDRPLGTNEITAEPADAGHYHVQGNYLNAGGRWKVEVAIRRLDADDTVVAFQVDAAADGAIRPLNSIPSLAHRLAGWLTSGGGWLTGSALIVFALGWVIPAVWAARGKLDLALLLLPSLVAMGVGVSQIAAARSGPRVAPSGDLHALALLAESEAAMNRLTSVQLLRTTRGDEDTGAVVTETVIFQAPDLFYDLVSNGSENMAHGTTYYYRDPGETLWQAVPHREPFIFPNFVFSPQAVSARLGKVEEVDGRPAQTVMFTIYFLGKSFAFTRWIDVETKLILREYMDAPGHHMLSTYYDYNKPVVIPIPAPSEIGPTPTVTIP